MRIGVFSSLAALLIGQTVAALGQSMPDPAQAGIQAFEAHDFVQAEEIFAALAKRDPSARNYSLLGMSESARGEVDQAVAHFRRSVQLGNNSAIVHYNLGLSYLQQKKPAFGAREIQLALSIDPNFRSARYTLAVVLLDAGRPQEALPHLLQLRQESPCDAAVWANLARAQFETGNTQAALHTIDEATRGMSRNVPLFVTVAEICTQHQQLQKARYLLESASELSPEDPDIKLLLAKAALKAGEPVEVIAVLKDVPASQGTPGVISFTRGLALALAGQEAEAQTELSAALKADPRSVRYMVALAWVYQLQDRQQEARETLVNALALDPHSAVVLYRMAVSSFLMSHYSEAVQYCEDTIRLAPHYDPAYLLSALALLEQGNADGAQSAVQQAVRIAPDKSIYHREFGAILFQRGQLAESKNELDLAISLDPKAPSNYLVRSRTEAGLGNDGPALQDLETTVALQPDNRAAYTELARLYTKTGQPQKAAEAQAKEKEIKTSSSLADRHEFLSGMANPLE
jgi:tetratricopeptide (TPR) repeat protein